MLISIHNRDNGSLTTYDPAELRRLAQAAVKGKGRLFAFTLSIDQRSGAVSLHASYYINGNPQSQTFESIAL